MTTLPKHTLSYPTATLPNDPPSPILYVPSILLALLVTVNIITVIIAIGFLIRRYQRRIKKRNEFTIRMSEITDQFTDEIQYQSYREAMALYHTRTLSNATTITRAKQTDTTNPSTATTAQTEEDTQQNRKLTVQENINLQESSNVEAQIISIQKPEKIEGRQDKRLESTVSVQLSTNAAYHSQEKLDLLPYDEPIDGSMEVHTNMAYGDTKRQESGPSNHSNRGLITIQQKISKQSVKNHSKPKLSFPALSSSPNYTYIDSVDNRGPLLTNNQQKDSYQRVEDDHSMNLKLSVPTLSSSPNYTYIDFEPAEHEYDDVYESPTETSSLVSDGPNYTYIDHEITSIGSKEGEDYYSTIFTQN